jgi:YgiT-type zinc finger domain-containing protein
MTARFEKYDNGKCDICGALMKERQIKQDFWIRGELIVIEDVLAGICPRCGEKIVNAAVGRRISEIIDNKASLLNAPKLLVPAIKYAAEHASV